MRVYQQKPLLHGGFHDVGVLLTHFLDECRECALESVLDVALECFAHHGLTQKSRHGTRKQLGVGRLRYHQRHTWSNIG
eukprot:30614-Eustigmatos_ZCMA.PRE.1